MPRRKPSLEQQCDAAVRGFFDLLLGGIVQVVVLQAVAPQQASEGIDSKEGQAGSVLERGEGLVDSEPLRESLGALGAEYIPLETAKEK